ncbi:transglutaminase domain-containing protein [bacterium]|nr:transglutaminase domain-containing protein [bacterium]
MPIFARLKRLHTGYFKICIILFSISFSINLCGENYLLNGGQASQIAYRMDQRIQPVQGTKQLVLSYVEPASFESPSYKQQIQKFQISYSYQPQDVKRFQDQRGNAVIQAIWDNPAQPLTVQLSIDAYNRTDLEILETDAEFPLYSLPPEVRVYLQPTRLVPSDHPQIISKARELTQDAATEFDAVQKILTWIIDRVRYVQRPEDYSAIYSLKTGKGNCQNYSHLAATFMRAVGIPVRIVNGVTLKEPYQIQVTGGQLTMRMAQGRHSWIEVFFPDLGWVPFDPQQMQMFVSNRFIRVETGLDNDETVNDGTVRWTKSRNSSGNMKFNELIDAEFVQDKGQFFASKQLYGPKKMLFTPEVETAFSQVAFEAMSSGPAFFEQETPGNGSKTSRFIFGNLDFPEHINFYEVMGDIEDAGNGEMLLRKNFIVETAEFATTEGKKYAQTFLLDNTVVLDTISLALQKFGGDGQLWIELFTDDGQGKPGIYLSGSEMIPLKKMPQSYGYQWIDFDFQKELLILKPGRYWICLAYTGSPIVNWFFTYGKPVGPGDGTRYNTLFDTSWSHSLAFEFNYRVLGKYP